MTTTKLKIAIYSIGLSVFLTNQVQAKFEKSEKNLYQSYLDLQVEKDNRIEYYAYAITQGCAGCEVLYLLVMDFKGQTRVWKSFRCDLEFKVLKTSHNGLYDIGCKSHVLGGEPPVSSRIYTYDGNDYVAD